MHRLVAPPASRKVARRAATYLACLVLAAAVMPIPFTACAATPPAPRPTGGQTLFVPGVPESVVVSDAVPLTIPGRTSIADTLDAEFHRRAEEQYEFGRSLETQGLTGTAIVAYRNALHIDPTLRDANYRMGLLFLKSDQVQAALECFAREVQHHPDHSDAQREFGLTLARDGQGELAVAHLTRLVTLRPKDGLAWHALGYAYQVAKRPNDAERALRKSIALPPEDAEEHRDLGAVLAGAGRDPEARIEYRRALAMSPGDPSAWYNLGNLERRDGRPDSAVAAYRRAERADSLFRPAWQMETQTLIENGRREEAAEAYRRWLDQLPEDHGARMSAIRYFTDLDRPGEALEIARDGVRHAGEAAETHEILGTTLAAQGRWRPALEEIRRAETLFQGDPQRMPALDAVVAHLRASAPDSLHTLFARDSVDTAARRAAFLELKKQRKAKIAATGN